MGTVEVDEDIFMDLCWNRVSQFTPAQRYDDDFWNEAFELLSESGWMSEPSLNNPMYIVDNIAVNGDICAVEDCVDNYDEITEKYNGNVDEWVEDNGYTYVGNYVVLNWGL